MGDVVCEWFGRVQMVCLPAHVSGHCGAGWVDHRRSAPHQDPVTVREMQVRLAQDVWQIGVARQ